MKERIVYCVTCIEPLNGLPNTGSIPVHCSEVLVTESVIRAAVREQHEVFPRSRIAVWRRGIASHAVLLCAFDAQGEVDYAALADPSSYSMKARDMAGRVLHDYEDEDVWDGSQPMASDARSGRGW